MIKLSVYIKDLNYDPSSYYRIIQYTSKLDSCNIFYHPQLSERQYQHFMPISKQNVFIKAYLQIIIMLKMLFALIIDLKNRVDIVIISRRIINRCFPLLFKILLKKIKKNGAKIYWDFDDHILESKETSVNCFEYFCKISDKIIVTHDFLKKLVLQQYQNKVELLSTTDGDIYLKFNNFVTMKRLELLQNELKIVWIGTSINLQYLYPLISVLDRVCLSFDKKIVLNVVCNESVNYQTENLKINNIKWTRKTAIDVMFDSHLGLMPLKISDFAKGKGGFKLVQYLSASLPVISSNVGFNKEVCDDSVGKLLDDIYDEQSLKESLSYIIENWECLSKNAFKKWNKKFSFDKALLFWKDLTIKGK